MAGVVINEFLALNTTGLMDQDGDRSDWIELYNDSPAPVNLAGWHLTDDSGDLTQWEFPSVNIPAGGFLVVFASGKDRAIAGSELHTDFNLSGDGEFLGLVMPDGTTVVDAFDPFPAQVANVSYGRGASTVSVEPIIDQTESVRVHVPTSGVLSTNWTATAFDDGSWIAGDTAIGHERSPGGSIDYNQYFEFDTDSLMPAEQARDTIYMRVPFNVTDIGALQSMTLSMQYDDGFVAYLNGQVIAQRNAPMSPAWNSAATGSHTDEEAILYESIPVSEHLDKLVEGANVLAIHGLNAANNRGDFLIGPMLQVERAGEVVEGFMATPTPNAANQQGTLGVVADTNFSVDRGFYDTPFTVQITTATPGAEIRYTLDGSVPTATTGNVYNPLNPPLINTTTNLRAAAFKTGFTPTNIDTQTYIFLDDVLEQDGVGILPHENWGELGPDWEMDPNVVNDPLYAGTLKDDLKSVPTVSLTMPWETWFGAGGIYISGKNIEKPGSVEMITANGSQEFQIDAALEIMGGTSTNRWNTNKLSMRVTFKQPFGPTNLEEEIFVNPFFDDGAATQFDTFILDAVYNHAWTYSGTSGPQFQRDTAKYIQDQFLADLQNFSGGQAPHGRFVHLYLNGLYWGMYYLHERPDDSFAEAYLGGDKDDYDVLKHNRTDVVAGNPPDVTARYDQLILAARQDMSVPANYTAVQQQLDIDNFIDYVLVNYYGGNTDWAHHNWYATFNRVDPNGKWRFHNWDAEHVLKSVTEDRTLDNDANTPTEIHHRLSVNPEYRLRFADRVQKHFYNGGVMSAPVAASIYQARMLEVDRAIVGESARWGDVQREPAYTRADWLATQNSIIDTYFPFRTDIVLGQFSARGWSVPLVAPVFSQYGGTVNQGYMLTLTKPAGSPPGADIYYTLDGTDPRDPLTNLPRAAAILYSGPISINAATQVNARILSDDPFGSMVDEWSPIVEAKFFLPTPFPLRITELHYNPAPRAGVAQTQDMEFIELLNTGSASLSLNGVQITSFSDSGYAFAPGTNLAAGERIIVAKNPVVFQQVYGAGHNVLAAGYGTDNLSNGGERIILLGPLGETLQDFTWSDSGLWPTTPDGGGPSLEIIDPMGSPTSPANWRASALVGGSPGSSGVVGDYDGNGIVDQADHARWRGGYGLTVAVGVAADGNRDGTIDAADYVVWRNAMAGGGSGATTVTTVASETAEQQVNEPAVVLVASSNLAALADPPPTNDAAFEQFFTQFEHPRPARRPAFSRPLVALLDDDLLLASLAATANRAAVDASDQHPNAEHSVDEAADALLAQWTGVDNWLDSIR